MGNRIEAGCIDRLGEWLILKGVLKEDWVDWRESHKVMALKLSTLAHTNALFHYKGDSSN